MGIYSLDHAIIFHPVALAAMRPAGRVRKLKKVYKIKKRSGIIFPLRE